MLINHSFNLPCLLFEFLHDFMNFWGLIQVLNGLFYIKIVDKIFFNSLSCITIVKVIIENITIFLTALASFILESVRRIWLVWTKYSWTLFNSSISLILLKIIFIRVLGSFFLSANKIELNWFYLHFNIIMINRRLIVSKPLSSGSTISYWIPIIFCFSFLTHIFF